MGIDLADVVRGDMAPSLCLTAIAGLPRGSKTLSMMMAEQHGGEWMDYYGKTPEWYLLADLYDTLNLNTAVSGNWAKGKAPKFPPYERPGHKKKLSLKGLHAALNHGGGGTA